MDRIRRIIRPITACVFILALSAQSKPNCNGNGNTDPPPAPACQENYDQFDLAKPARPPERLYFVADGALAKTDQMLVMLALQGILSQQQPRIWIENPINEDPALINDMKKRHGVIVDESYRNDPWALIQKFATEIRGYYLYEPLTPSQTLAMSLAGITHFVPVAIQGDSGQWLEDKIRSLGITDKVDLRGISAENTLEEYKKANPAWTSQSVVIEADLTRPDIHRFLYDFAILQKAFVYDGGPNSSAWRDRVLQSFCPHPIVFGWGDEVPWIQQLSKNGAAAVAADYARNLSVFAGVREQNLTQLTHRPVQMKPDPVHYVAFVMSDGDNIQWLTNAFVASEYWNAPQRKEARFSISWEFAPTTADVAPSVLRFFQLTSNNQDNARDFLVSGPSGHAYMDPSYFAKEWLQPFADQTGQYAAKADLKVVSLLNAKKNLFGCEAFLNNTNVDGVLYKGGNRYRGKNEFLLKYHNSKPCLAYTLSLWEGGQQKQTEISATFEDTPGYVLYRLKTAATTGGAFKQFTLVNIHAWSRWREVPGEGPLDAVQWIVDRLPTEAPDVEVINAGDMIELLRGLALKH